MSHKYSPDDTNQMDKRGIKCNPGVGQSFLRHLVRGSPKGHCVVLSHAWLSMHLWGELGMLNQISLKNSQMSYMY